MSSVEAKHGAIKYKHCIWFSIGKCQVKTVDTTTALSPKILLVGWHPSRWIATKTSWNMWCSQDTIWGYLLWTTFFLDFISVVKKNKTNKAYVHIHEQQIASWSSGYANMLLAKLDRLLELMACCEKKCWSRVVIFQISVWYYHPIFWEYPKYLLSVVLGPKFWTDGLGGWNT